jgi:hypothetical protein
LNSFCSLTQGGTSLALGYYLSSRWGFSLAGIRVKHLCIRVHPWFPPSLAPARRGIQFSAECNPPVPARNAIFIRSGFSGEAVAQFHRHAPQ